MLDVIINHMLLVLNAH